MEIRHVFKIVFLLITILLGVLLYRFGVPFFIIAPVGFLMGSGASYWANKLADWLEAESA